MSKWVLVSLSLVLVSCQSLPPRMPAAGDYAEISPPPLFLCSFNIQFLGSSTVRQDEALAQILADQGCDLVTIQELVAPPDLRRIPSSPHYKQKEMVQFPDGERHRPKEEVTRFFLAMHKRNYDGMILSDEDTGRSKKNRNNGSATEWWVTFYRTDKLQFADDLPHGFLSETVSAHPTWDRVPHAFSFRTTTGQFDFVLISVHLRPGKGPAPRTRRAQELRGIYSWIKEQHLRHPERDYIILGDMNLYSAEELALATPPSFASLNTNADHSTNTNLNGPLPYDHVLVNPHVTTEVPLVNNFRVLNLLDLARPYWRKAAPYPGHKNTYNHDQFRFHFSDHHPIGFWVYPTTSDRDGTL